MLMIKTIVADLPPELSEFGKSNTVIKFKYNGTDYDVQYAGGQMHVNRQDPHPNPQPLKQVIDMNQRDPAVADTPVFQLLAGLADAMTPAVESAHKAALDSAVNIIVRGDDPNVGYLSFPPSTVVWCNRGNFVEVAVAQLGVGDTFDLIKGIRVATEHMFQGNFLLVPCNSKVPGFSARDVVANLFDANILNGNALFDRALLEKSKATFNAEMARRGAAPTNV